MRIFGFVALLLFNLKLCANLHATTLYLEIDPSSGGEFKTSGELLSDAMFNARVYATDNSDLFKNINTTINGFATSMANNGDTTIWTTINPIGPITNKNLGASVSNPFNIAMAYNGTNIVNTNIDCMFTLNLTGDINPKTMTFTVNKYGVDIKADLNLAFDIAQADHGFEKTQSVNVTVDGTQSTPQSFTVKVDDNSDFLCVNPVYINSQNINSLRNQVFPPVEPPKEIEEILIPDNVYQEMINGMSPGQIDVFNETKGTGLPYVIYLDYILADGILLLAFQSLSNQQLNELMALASIDKQVEYLIDIYYKLPKSTALKSMACGSNIHNLSVKERYKYCNIDKMGQRYINLRRIPFVAFSLKENAAKTLCGFNKEKLKQFNSLNVDIRNLFNCNNMALSKFGELSNKEVNSFIRMSPYDQLQYVLTNFNITYIKRNIEPIINKMMNWSCMVKASVNKAGMNKDSMNKTNFIILR